MAIMSVKTKDNQQRWLVRVRDGNGKWFRAKRFRRKPDAERYERELESLADQGGLAQASETQRILFGTFAAKWCAERRSKVSRGWRLTQDQMLRDYVLPTLGTRKLCEIRPEHVGQVLLQMQKAGRGAQLQLHVYNLMSRIFGQAVRYYRVLSESPVSEQDKPEPLKVERPHLNPDEARRLLVASRDLPIGPAIWLATLATMRASEIQALTVGAIDFERGQIHIRAAFKRKVREIEPYPKQRRAGLVPMAPVLADYLRSRTAGKRDDEFVVSGVNQAMLDHLTFLARVVDLCKELGLPRVTPHGLRHSGTELWVEQGASEEDLVRLLNHSGAAAVRRYIHPTHTRLQEIALKIQVQTPEVTPPPRAPTPPLPTSGPPRLRIVR